jgi:hypothetical protein
MHIIFNQIALDEKTENAKFYFINVFNKDDENQYFSFIRKKQKYYQPSFKADNKIKQCERNNTKLKTFTTFSE